jgi:hypothetical protein
MYCSVPVAHNPSIFELNSALLALPSYRGRHKPFSGALMATQSDNLVIVNFT